MSRYIDADGLIADMQERYCKPCKERKEDYNGVRCRACWVGDAMDEVDGFGDKGIDIVRCRDCRRWTDGDGVFGICRWNDCITRQTLKDAGCTYGERREKR